MPERTKNANTTYVRARMRISADRAPAESACFDSMRLGYRVALKRYRKESLFPLPKMAQECTPDVMSRAILYAILYAIHSFSSREKA